MRRRATAELMSAAQLGTMGSKSLFVLRSESLVAGGLGRRGSGGNKNWVRRAWGLPPFRLLRID